MSPHKLLLVFFLVITSCVATNKVVPDGPSGKKDVVYLLHGLGRSRFAMWVLASRLEDAGFLVNNIGYSSMGQTPDEILIDVSGQINESLPEADHTVHFVGHSLGGLMIRAYLAETKIKHLGKVVLIGTPNRGTSLVDAYRDAWWMQMMGPTALALGTDEGSFPISIADPYYPVGVIAGVSNDNDNEEVLPGQDDGLVPLESTRLNGMTDMIIVESNHWMLRYDREVAMQTIAFLLHGEFQKTNE